jgi:hypothetical protein
MLPSRSIQDATPALLPFLSFIKPWPSIKVYLYLNSFDGLKRSALPKLFGEDALRITCNLHTIENCENSWPLFMVNTLQRFRTDLQSEVPDISTTCIMYLNDDIYLDGIDAIMEEIINGTVVDEMAIAPTINPLYDRKGDWHKGTMRYFDWWGLVTSGLWLHHLINALHFLHANNITVGSGPLATAKVVGERNGSIVRLEGATAYLLRETTSKAGQVENSLNMLACVMFQGSPSTSWRPYEKP